MLKILQGEEPCILPVFDKRQKGTGEYLVWRLMIICARQVADPWPRHASVSTKIIHVYLHKKCSDAELFVPVILGSLWSVLVFYFCILQYCHLCTVGKRTILGRGVTHKYS